MFRWPTGLHVDHSRFRSISKTRVVEIEKHKKNQVSPQRLDGEDPAFFRKVCSSLSYQELPRDEWTSD